MRSACSQLQGDLADRDAVIAAARGCDAIFHNAAKAGAWGSYDSYHRANVIGTDNVIAACRTHRHRQPRLHLDARASPIARRIRSKAAPPTPCPTATHFKAHYATTKTDRRTSSARRQRRERSRPIALRPRLIWGPGDEQLLPRLVRARARRAPAHRRQWRQPDRHHLHRQRRAGALRCVRPSRARRGVRRAARTSSATASRSRRATSSTRCSRAAGAPPVTKHLAVSASPTRSARCAKRRGRVLPLRGEPPLTRFLAEQLATTHWYDMGPATRDFGYVPQVSIDRRPARLQRVRRMPARARPCASRRAGIGRPSRLARHAPARMPR